MRLALFLLCLLPLCATAQYGEIIGDPTDRDNRPQYEGFGPHDLPFFTGRAELGTGTLHDSREFYAVILQSKKAVRGEACVPYTEAVRKAAQRLAPHHKVFTSREGCSGTVVHYLGTAEGYDFMAVFGGYTKAEAQALLPGLKAKYPGANVRKMQVRLDFADE